MVIMVALTASGHLSHPATPPSQGRKCKRDGSALEPTVYAAASCPSPHYPPRTRTNTHTRIITHKIPSLPPHTGVAVNNLLPVACLTAHIDATAHTQTQREREN